MTSNIKQENLATFYGIKKEDQIREWLHKFEEVGLIQIINSKLKGQYGTFDRCAYKLHDEHFVLISNKLHDQPVSRELKGFLILLKCKCLNGSNMCKYTQDELASELSISPASISRYIKKGIEAGYIKKNKKGIHLLHKDIFIITKETLLAQVKGFYPQVLDDDGYREDGSINYIIPK